MFNKGEGFVLSDGHTYYYNKKGGKDQERTKVLNANKGLNGDCQFNKSIKIENDFLNRCIAR